MEELLKAAGNFGFPIAVSAYLLIRLEGKLERVSSSINELAMAVRTLNKDTEVHHGSGKRSG